MKSSLQKINKKPVANTRQHLYQQSYNTKEEEEISSKDISKIKEKQKENSESIIRTNDQQEETVSQMSIERIYAKNKIKLNIVIHNINGLKRNNQKIEVLFE